MIESPGFLQFIRSAPGITPEEEGRILQAFQYIQLKQKEHFCREGEICKQIAYIDKGCMSYYRLLAGGRKSIIHFGFEDWWVGDLESFLKRKPASTYWQAVERTELIAISRNSFETLMNESPAFQVLFQRKTQEAYLKAIEKAAKDKMETAEEKYMRLLEEYPQIIQRVPHYDVAAYLGIAPESLSRIRKKITRKSTS